MTKIFLAILCVSLVLALVAVKTGSDEARIVCYGGLAIVLTICSLLLIGNLSYLIVNTYYWLRIINRNRQRSWGDVFVLLGAAAIFAISETTEMKPLLMGLSAGAVLLCLAWLINHWPQKKILRQGREENK